MLWLTQFRPPRKLDTNDPNISDSFAKWKRELQVILGCLRENKKANVTRRTIILTCAGPDFITVYDYFVWAEEGDKDRPGKLLEKLEEYCASKGNVVVN